MAIVQNPITGRSRKAFGNAVFSESYGQNTLRTKPFRYRDAQTPAQLSVREKIRVLTRLISQCVPVINEAYAGTTRSSSPYSRIIGINFKNAYTGEPPVLDHTKVVFCEFNGSTVDKVVLTATPDHGVHVAWDPNTTNPDELASYLTFLVIKTETNEVLTLRSVAQRSAGTVDFTVPKTWVGSKTALHIVSTDSVNLLKGYPRMIIKFKAGVDASSIIQ